VAYGFVRLALALFMARVAANDTNDALATDNFAIVAELLD
jgi:hypothetical protein